MKEEKYSEENIVLIDTLTDTATANFGCTSFLSESKKSNIIEVVELIYGLFPKRFFSNFALVNLRQ